MTPDYPIYAFVPTLYRGADNVSTSFKKRTIMHYLATGYVLINVSLRCFVVA